MNIRRTIAAAVAVLALAGCGLVGPKGSPAGNDLPGSQIEHNRDKRTVYENAEDFPNVVVWCDGTTRIYTTQRDQRPIVLVLNDKQCGGTGGTVVQQPQ